MPTEVLFYSGLRSKYDSIATKQENALYFCTDTKELFKGSMLVTDGVRTVESYDKLPAFSAAADGILYFCADTKNGFIVNSTRDAWIQVLYGPVTDLAAVSAEDVHKFIPTVGAVKDAIAEISGGGELVPIATTEVAGKVKASTEILVAVDGTMSVGTIAQSKVEGLEEDLQELKDKIGELSPELYLTRKYEVTNGLFADTLVNYGEKEIRIMFSKDTVWTKQAVGPTGDSSKYYMGFKAYAPENAVSFKEDMAVSIGDQTMHSFVDNKFAGTDKYGRNYSIIWLAAASYDAVTNTWTYYGAKSTNEKYIGWYYSVEWYDASNNKIGADTIRINLTNEDCHTTYAPCFMNEYAKLEEVKTLMSWQTL